jgi:hypothetical protein
MSRIALVLPLKRGLRTRTETLLEGDYERLDRPQVAKVVLVSPREARASVKFFADLIEAIHKVTS